MVSIMFFWFSVADLGCLIIFNFSLNMLLNLGQPCTVKFLPALSSHLNRWFVFIIILHVIHGNICMCRCCVFIYHVCMRLCMCVQACMLERERQRDRQTEREREGEKIVAHCVVSYFVGVHVADACASQVSNVGTACWLDDHAKALKQDPLRLF